MKKTLLILVAIFSLLCSSISLGQVKPISNEVVDLQKKQASRDFSNSLQTARGFYPTDIVKCASTEYNNSLKSNGLSISDNQFENWMALKIAEFKNSRMANPNQVNAIITIPVVVHVIHNGDAYGTGENITDEQVLSQIQVMNEDFRRMAGTPGFGPGVDVEIEFCMAQTDPSGNPTNGINRVNLGVASWDNAGAEGTLKPSTQWNPNNYLNMWTCRFGGDLNGVLGYAQFPDASGLAGMPASGGAANTDGVIMAFNAFGSSDIYPSGSYAAPYDKGRTTTHEVGHWLGLRHIWGDGNCTVDDFCADTPTAAAANFGCPTGTDSCAGGGVDQIENYMDYTDDACMDRFTQNQKDRMLTVMSVSPRRASLASSTACQAPAPYIQFGSSTGSINEGNSCNFTDYNFPINILRAPSANAIVTFNLGAGTATQGVDYIIVNPSVTFPAGSTASQILTIRVFNDGIVETDETIIVNLSLNANGGDAVLNAGASSITVTLTNNDFAPNPLTTTTLLTEDFEDLTGWLVLDQDGDSNAWGRVNGLDGLGTAPNTISGRAGFSEKRLTYLGGTGTANPVNNYLISPQVVIPSGANAVDLSYIVGAYDDSAVQTRNAGNFSVYFTTSIANEAAILAGTLIQSNLVVNEGTTQLRTHNLLALAGQTGYIVFRHNNTAANTNTGLLLLDTVLLQATISTDVQQDVNNATRYTATIPTSGDVYGSDSSTSKIMARINNSNTFNYGCTTVEVDRSVTSAGAATSDFLDTAITNSMLSKTFFIDAESDTASGNYQVTLYFTEAEVANWEVATGRNRSELKIIKVIDNPISAVNISNLFSYSVEEVTATIGSFGPNVTFTATFTSNLKGGYGISPATGINCGDVTTVWNGASWSNGVPSKVKAVTLNGNYTSSGNLEACSLTVSNNANVTISSGDTFIVNGDVTVNAGSTLTVENNAALRQVDDLATNTGNIIVNRNSDPMIRLDYTAWSSPVSNQQLQAFSPNTVATRFYEYLYTGTTTPTAYQSVTPTNNFTAGKGYMIRVDNTWSSVSASAYNGQFTGVPFNGVVNQAVGLGYNLLGNPYASPIDADVFLADNSNIGTLYFWTNTTPASGGIYPQNNFASYTTLGGTGAFASAKIPNGTVQTGQGFYVQATSAGTTSFNNAQRIDASTSTQFFKNANVNQVEKHRVWLNLNDANTSYNQILVGYMEGATNGVDNMIDGKVLDTSKPMLYNVLNDEAYVIQGKALPFNDEDVIALGLQVTEAGNYNVNIEQVDGLFDSQDIFLKDNQTGIIHDLKQGAYQFTTNAGTFTDRFELVFKQGSLSQETQISENVISVYSNSTGIQINSSEKLDQIIVFDVLGRKLFEASQIQESNFTIQSILSTNQALIVKVKDVNGNTKTQKIVY